MQDEKEHQIEKLQAVQDEKSTTWISKYNVILK